MGQQGERRKVHRVQRKGQRAGSGEWGVGCILLSWCCGCSSVVAKSIVWQCSRERSGFSRLRLQSTTSRSLVRRPAETCRHDLMLPTLPLLTHWRLTHLVETLSEQNQSSHKKEINDLTMLYGKRILLRNCDCYLLHLYSSSR